VVRTSILVTRPPARPPGAGNAAGQAGVALALAARRPKARVLSDPPDSMAAAPCGGSAELCPDPWPAPM